MADASRNKRSLRVASLVLPSAVVALYVRQGLRRPRLSLLVPPGRRRLLHLSQGCGAHQRGSRQDEWEIGKRGGRQKEWERRGERARN